MTASTIYNPIVVVISREEVNAQDIGPSLGLLRSFIDSPDKAESALEKLDIVFQGYDEDSRELFEIQEVREFVHKLDGEFPFWLYFLTKTGLGLQALLLCFLPPYLTPEGKAKIFPERIRELLLNRWLPAMNQICEYVGMSEDEIDQLTDRALSYMTRGRFPVVEGISMQDPQLNRN